jgi:hypothetical protein
MDGCAVNGSESFEGKLEVGPAGLSGRTTSTSEKKSSSFAAAFAIAVKSSSNHISSPA